MLITTIWLGLIGFLDDYIKVHKKNKEEASVAFSEMVKLMDTAAGKGIYHKNTVARKKSRMAKLLNSIA